MHALRLFTITAFTVVLAVAMSSCGSDDGGGDPVTPAAPIVVSGTASKDDIVGATVNLHRFTSSVGMGALVAGPYTTDQNGAWTGEVPAGTNEALLVVVTGGSYTDESTGSTVDLTSDLYGVWRPSTKIGNATPLTHALVLNAQQRQIDGASATAAIGAAIAEMESAFGYDVTGVGPEITKGAQPTSAQLYAAFLAGISTLLDGNPNLSPFSGASVWVMVVAIVWDMTDGVLDGTDIFGNTIEIDPDGSGPSGPIAWPGLDAGGIDAIVAAANQWTSTNAPGVIVPPIDLTNFADTGGNGTGQVFVSGFLNVSGSGMVSFGSPFVPTVAAASFNAGAGAFSLASLQSQSLTIGFTTGTNAVSIVSAAAGLTAWGVTSFPNPVPGITISNQGTEWVIQFEGVDVSGVQGNTTNIIFNGTLTVTVPSTP